jgi:hypothetical protein
MKTAALVAAFRRATDDKVAAFNFQEPDILEWLREAEDEAAMRKRLLFEACDPQMCEVSVEAARQSYRLHPRWFLITKAWHGDAGCRPRDRRELVIRSRGALDALLPDWRTDDSRRPWAITLHGGVLQMAGWVSRPGTVFLEGYRLPMKPLGESEASQPEIHEIHHRHLIDWALYRGYSVPDSEVLNPQESQLALARFEAYFGLRVDADLLQDTVDDQVHHNQAWF